MNQYERRFYEDIHKLVIIQEKILKELKKLNEPLTTEKTVEEERKMIEEIVAHYFEIKESE